MDKLSLDLDDLQVTSFATDEQDASADGTVQGQAETGADVCLEPIQSQASCFDCSLLQTQCGCGTFDGCGGTYDGCTLIGCGQETLICPDTVECPPPGTTNFCPY